MISFVDCTNSHAVDGVVLEDIRGCDSALRCLIERRRSFGLGGAS